MDFDTIVAVATPTGQSGVGIVRLSGESSSKIVDKMFKTPTGKIISSKKSNTINYGFILDGEKIIDEVLVSIFRAPKSYTGEDIVEINCHGGRLPIKATMELALKHGARLAEPGEFTKRAFLNGRIDLSQAEGIMDIIAAKTELGLDFATKQALGKISERIKGINDIIIGTLAHIEATIDYPDEDFDDVDSMEILHNIISAKEGLEKLLETAKTGKIVREGIKTTIVGKPNVGKSSLLNTLLKHQRAIVTEIPGTTRDILEEQINIKGVPLIIVDTAGIRETEDVVEKIGVERSKKAIEESDLILFVLDGSKAWDSFDEQILSLISGKNIIVVINKLDLDQRLSIGEIENKIGSKNIVNISVLENKNIEILEEVIFDLYDLAKIKNTYGDIFITNLRHEQAIRDSIKSLSDAKDNINKGMPLDIVAIDLRDTWEILGKITGETLNKNIIDEIFSRFCLGK